MTHYSNIILIDGNKISSENELHNELQKKLKFPDYYGKNLDALWDMFTAWIPLPLTIVIKNYEKLRTNLGEDYPYLIKLLDRAEEEINGFGYVMIPSIGQES